MDVWDLFAEAPPAKPFLSRDCARPLKTQGDTSHLNTCEQSMQSSPNGCYGKMSLELSAHPETPLAASWRDWLATIPQSRLLVGDGQIVGFSLPKMKNPIPWPGESWTPNISESPSAAVESSLSDILEMENGGNLLKYCLSDQAKAGILRRAEKRGKKLPEMLVNALRQ